MSRRLAFLFPGQGTLPTRLPELSPDLDALYTEIESGGLAIRDWLEEGSAERLRATDAAQPCVFLDSLAKLAALRRRGIAPDVVAGHSLGEYSALVAAGVLGARVALDLVSRRGRLMCKITGGMTALLKLDRETVHRLCATSGGRVAIANDNGPGQFVVSGPLEGLDDVERLAAEAGGRCVRLAVSGPFHSYLMRPAEAELAPFIVATPFATPRAIFISSASGRTEADPARLKALLATQITAAVRWTDVLTSLVDLGVTDAIEVGPGSILSQLGKRAQSAISFRAFEEV